MKRSFLLCLTLLLSTAVLWAQKPALDHSVYDGWKSVNRPVIQEGSEWAVWLTTRTHRNRAIFFFLSTNDQNVRNFVTFRLTNFCTKFFRMIIHRTTDVCGF